MNLSSPRKPGLGVYRTAGLSIVTSPLPGRSLTQIWM
jgi:hypothetical protein